VVSRNLRRAADATDIASSLQDAVARWSSVRDALAQRFDDLERDAVPGGTFDVNSVAAPLPHAPQWLDGSVFETHLELMARALHPDKPYEATTFPWIYQGNSDDFLGPTDDIAGFRAEEGVDFEGEVAVVVDDVPMRRASVGALAHVILIMLVNDISLRTYAGREIKVGFGFINAKPSTAFSPVAVTPDELGDAWSNGRVHLPLDVQWNGRWFGSPNAGDMSFGFHEMIEHAARTRPLRAGTIIGSGTVSSRARSVGSACIAERRAIEIIDQGRPQTGYLENGDRVHLEMRLPSGESVFGAIDQRVVISREEPE
jgi:fumarylacetoacetate (FAA) hydrolase